MLTKTQKRQSTIPCVSLGSISCLINDTNIRIKALEDNLKDFPL